MIVRRLPKTAWNSYGGKSTDPVSGRQAVSDGAVGHIRQMPAPLLAGVVAYPRHALAFLDRQRSQRFSLGRRIAGSGAASGRTRVRYRCSCDVCLSASLERWTSIDRRLESRHSFGACLTRKGCLLHKPSCCQAWMGRSGHPARLVPINDHRDTHCDMAHVGSK